MTRIATDRLAEVFVEMADTLVDDFDVVELMQTLATRTSELMDGVSTGLLLADPRGKLQLVGASNEQARMIELFQVQAVEGPCQDCFRLGTAIVNADLTEAAGRWPRFAPRAVEAGFRSVHAFPLRLRGERIGAMNLFGTERGRIAESDADIVQALADVATIGVLQQRTIRQGEQLTEQLQHALHSRVAVEQAKGVLSQVHGSTPEEAFERLRTWCRARGRRISEVAFELVADPAAYPELTDPASRA